MRERIGLGENLFPASASATTTGSSPGIAESARKNQAREVFCNIILFWEREHPESLKNIECDQVTAASSDYLKPEEEECFALAAGGGGRTDAP